MSEQEFTFRIGLDVDYEKSAIFKAYQVETHPTTYLLDAGGKIVWRGVGFEEKALREALAKLRLE